jgi:hypothetical protein
MSEWSQREYTDHQRAVTDWIEECVPELLDALEEVLIDAPVIKPRTQPIRTNWRNLVLRRLAQDCATYEELLEAIQEKRGHGGVSSRDILTGVLNQLDDDGLIYISRSYGCAWYNLSKRGRAKVAA